MSMEQLIQAFAKQNPEVARQIFNERIATETDLDRVADLEIAREYFCNEEFSSAFAGHVYDINN